MSELRSIRDGSVEYAPESPRDTALTIALDFIREIADGDYTISGGFVDASVRDMSRATLSQCDALLGQGLDAEEAERRPGVSYRIVDRSASAKALLSDAVRCTRPGYCEVHGGGEECGP